MAYRYEPRSYLQDPSFFGIRVDATWKEYGQDLSARQMVAAAFYQHIAACETLRQAGQQGWGMAELADKLGVNKAHSQPQTVRSGTSRHRRRRRLGTGDQSSHIPANTG